MDIDIETNFDVLVYEIGKFYDINDRTRLYNAMALPAIRVWESKFKIRNKYWKDRTGQTRETFIIRPGTRKFPASFVVDPIAYILDVGNQKFGGFDWVQDMLNTNREQALRAAIEGGYKGMAKLFMATARRVRAKTKIK